MREIRKLIDVSQVKKRIYHDERLIKRLRKLYPVVKDLFPDDSLEDWVNDFRYDLYPEIEIVWWETIASKFLNETKGKNLSSKEKMKIWRKLFSDSMN